MLAFRSVYTPDQLRDIPGGEEEAGTPN